jgi:hypothetical protein
VLSGAPKRPPFDKNDVKSPKLLLLSSQGCKGALHSNFALLNADPMDMSTRVDFYVSGDRSSGVALPHFFRLFKRLKLEWALAFVRLNVAIGAGWLGRMWSTEQYNIVLCNKIVY